jgi:aspartate 1-decarboxylase
MRQFLRSKIHRATITQTDLHYEGSLTLDRDLMDAASIADHEVIHVVNVNNGERFTTYAIEGSRGSGIVGLNGAAARLGAPGDLVIIMTFQYAEVAASADAPTPIVVPVDRDNRVRAHELTGI